MHSLIADETASVAQLFHAGCEAEAFNLLNESIAFSACIRHEPFKADAKQGAGCARRRIGDSLGFSENGTDVFRHVGGGANTATGRVDDFTVDLNNSAAAAWAAPKTDFFRRVELALGRENFKCVVIGATAGIECAALPVTHEGEEDGVLSK